MFLLPRIQSLDENNYNIDFNKDEYAFILIESEEKIEIKIELEKKVELILTTLSALFCNQFYYEEFYYIKKEVNGYEILKARIIPFPNRYIKKTYNYLFNNALGIQKHIGAIFQELSNHLLSDSLFNLTATLMASLKENVFETKAIFAWNFLEHLAARYWKKKNPNYLLKLKKKEYKNFRKRAVKCNEAIVQKDNILLTGGYSEKIAELLIPNNISPAKYRIFSMFEKKGIFEDKEKEKDKINKMYKIRNKLIHNGFSLEELRTHQKITFDPIEVVSTYNSFIYRKFLMFLNIIDNYAEFRYGKLILKEDNLEEHRTELQVIKNGEKKGKLILTVIKLSAEDMNNKLPIEKVDILNYINIFLEPFQSLTSEGTIEWNSVKEKVEIKVIYNIENNEFTLKMNNPPIGYARSLYSSRFQVKGDNPEDNIQMIERKIISFNYNNCVIHVLFFEKIIKQDIDMNEFYGLGKSDKKGQYLIFKIEEIQVNPS